MAKIKPIVFDLLKSDPKYRDSDNVLIARIWNNHLGGSDNTKKMTAHHLLATLAIGMLPSPESIRRMRQKLQEQNPELRGKSYKHRKTVNEQQVRDYVREK